MKNSIASILLSSLFFLAALAPLSSQVNPNLPDVFAPPPANGPNLVITRMAIKDLTATSLTVSFEIKNAGNQAAGLNGVSVQAYAHGKAKINLGNTSLAGISSLAPGQTHIQSMKAGFSQGNYKSLCLTIDPANALRETQEGDNSLCVSWQRGAFEVNTDLRAAPSYAGGNDLGIFRRSQSPGLVFFQIRNDGPVEAEASTTLIEYGDANNIRSLTLNTPAIPSYGLTTLSFSFPEYVCNEDYFIRIDIDYQFVVPETNEDNNIVRTQRCAE